MPTKAITKAQSEIIKGVESYLNIPLTARSFYVKNNVIGLDIAGLEQHEIHAVENYGRQFARFRVEPGGYKKVSLILMKPQNTPKENPMKRKPTPAQIAARERFAEMARSGAFKRKRNPAKKTVSQKISQLTREGYPQKQAVAIALSEERKGKVKRNPIKKYIVYTELKPGNWKQVRVTENLDIAKELAKSNAESGYPSVVEDSVGAILYTPQVKANPIILVSDKPIVTKRKSNPVKRSTYQYALVTDDGGFSFGMDQITPVQFTFSAQDKKRGVYRSFKLPAEVIKNPEFQAWATQLPGHSIVISLRDLRSLIKEYFVE